MRQLEDAPYIRDACTFDFSDEGYDTLYGYFDHYDEGQPYEDEDNFDHYGDTADIYEGD